LREVELPVAAVIAMRQHARATYPEECCGFLLVREHSHPRVVVSAERARNGLETERGRQFEIVPEELQRLEDRLDGSGTIVGGFYHSHPDGPARPSARDEEHAWPRYSHVILRVTSRTVGPVDSFEFDSDLAKFEPTRLTVRPGGGTVGSGRDSKNLLDESEET